MGFIYLTSNICILYLDILKTALTILVKFAIYGCFWGQKIDLGLISRKTRFSEFNPTQVLAINRTINQSHLII